MKINFFFKNIYTLNSDLSGGKIAVYFISTPVKSSYMYNENETTVIFYSNFINYFNLKKNNENDENCRGYKDNKTILIEVQC